MGLAIVVLAAGLGTRFGGMKQLAPLGPAGEVVADFTLHDAANAGFASAVVVIANDMVEPMAAHFDEFAPAIPVRLVVQPAADRARPYGKPWGTAHATLVGAEGLTGPFAVANADDSYGAEAIAAIANHLQTLEPRPEKDAGALVGFDIGSTLSGHGGVSRAVCVVDANDQLRAVAEHTGVRVEAGRYVSDAGALEPTTLISMNLWGFDVSFVDRLRPIVDDFISGHAHDDLELRLPDVVGGLIARDELNITVLPTTSTWIGVTHPADAPTAREQFATLIADGHYPDRTSDAPTAR